MSLPAPVAVFLHRGDYDAVHQGLSIAVAAAALGRTVDVYFFWWALERLVKDRLDEPDLDRDDVNATMELRAVPTLRQLLTLLRDAKGAQVFACTGSMAALGFLPPDVEPKVSQLIGWTGILQRTAGVVDRYYL